MKPPWRDTVLGDDDPDRLHVFVPAIMSVGVLFSLVSLVQDLARWGRQQMLDAHSKVAGHRTAALLTGRTAEAAARPRPRRWYGARAALALTFALYVAIGSIASYRRTDGYVEHLGWLLALALLVSTAAGIVGVALATATRWPDRPPLWAHELLQRLGLTPRPAPPEASAPVVLLRLGLLAGMLAAGLALVVVASPARVADLDEALAEHVVRSSWYGFLDVLDPLGSTEIALVLAAFTGLAAVRCLVLGAAYPAAVVASAVVGAWVKGTIDYARPDGGPFAGLTESFPSGHLIQLSIIAGLFPVALGVLSGLPRLVAPARVVLAIGVLGVAAARVHQELHWPSDVVESILIGSTAVLLAQWLLEHRSWHRHCHSCPWHPAPHHERRTHGSVPITPRVARLAHLAARTWSVAAVVVLAAVTLTVGLPSNPGSTGWGADVQAPVQLGLAALLVVGVVVAWRWEPVGAVLIAFTATALGVFATVEYRPLVAGLLVASFVVPAFLFWLSWQHDRRWGEVVVLGIGTVALLGSGWIGANRVFDSYFGPTHPESTTAGLPLDVVEWVWSGALQPRSTTVVARLTDHAEVVTVRAHPQAGGAAVESAAAATDRDRIARLTLTGLTPGTRYDYVVTVDGVEDRSRGRGQLTTPLEGPYSFRVTVASCARTGTNASVFDTVRDEGSLFFLQIGDLHYRNIDENSTAAFLSGYQDLLTAPAPAALWRSLPVAYVWDDHDYGPNDADATSPSRQAARLTYRQVVPHYPLPAGDGDAAIYQAFTIGRVRFILTDGRSERTDASLLGDAQLAWLLDELVTASRDHALVVWANEIPWIQEARPGADGWGAYPDERRLIADVIAGAGIEDLVMVSGDAHMVAIDDGTNSGYASDGSPGFPVLHAAALDRPGNVKGGPYSVGSCPGGGQYGRIGIVDDGGDTVTVSLEGRDFRGETLLSWSHPFGVAPPVEPSPTPAPQG